MKPKLSLHHMLSGLLLTLMLSLQVSSVLHDHSDDAHPFADGHICVHMNAAMAPSPTPDVVPAANGTSPFEPLALTQQLYRQPFSAYFGRAPPVIS